MLVKAGNHAVCAHIIVRIDFVQKTSCCIVFALALYTHICTRCTTLFHRINTCWNSIFNYSASQRESPHLFACLISVLVGRPRYVTGSSHAGFELYTQLLSGAYAGVIFSSVIGDPFFGGMCWLEALTENIWRKQAMSRTITAKWNEKGQANKICIPYFLP